MFLFVLIASALVGAIGGAEIGFGGFGVIGSAFIGVAGFLTLYFSYALISRWYRMNYLKKTAAMSFAAVDLAHSVVLSGIDRHIEIIDKEIEGHRVMCRIYDESISRGEKELSELDV